MADTKISALSEVTTPDVSDVLPIVSGGETKKITVQNLTGVTLSSLFTLTPPVIEDFTWVNQETATCTQNGPALYMAGVAQNAEDLRILEIVSPATPYTVTMGFIPHLSNRNYLSAGLVFRENATTKLSDWSYCYDSTLRSYYRTGTNAGGNGPDVTHAIAPLGPMCWLQLSDTGSLLKYRWSTDGVNFFELLSANRNTRFTTAPDRVGFYVGTQAQGTGYCAAMNILSWKVT